MIQLKNKIGKLFIISAPSGAGKSTLINSIINDNLNIVHSVSVTTRIIRPGEKEGLSYYFTSEEEFKKRIDNNEFIEWAQVHGNYYGTLVSEIEAITKSSRDVILDIDVLGAISIKKIDQNNAILIFIVPPSLEILKERLAKRGTDSDKAIERRLQNSVKEIAEIDKFDYVIINANLEKAVDDLRCIIKSIRLKCDNFRTLKF